MNLNELETKLQDAALRYYEGEAVLTDEEFGIYQNEIQLSELQSYELFELEFDFDIDYTNEFLGFFISVFISFFTSIPSCCILMSGNLSDSLLFVY